ncbi:MAG: hypothetical protein AB8B84_12995, partial [Granulosicoccus sp.]
YSWAERWRFIRTSMMSLAHATKLIKPADIKHPIFTRMMLYGRGKAAQANPDQTTDIAKIGERHIPS